jgi:SAM-dependent methyltransferase
MTQASTRNHWEEIYRKRSPEEVSWYQARPALSLAMIEATGASQDAAIVDVGGGASTLIDMLIAKDYRDLTVLDLSRTSLDHARVRLGASAGRVAWIEADVTTWSPPRRYAVWHDRAVFHFLTDEHDRTAYVAALDRALDADGHFIVATFGPDGPDRCSGLPVERYDAERMAETLGAGFRLIETRHEDHVTPAGVMQSFLYQRYRRAMSEW